MSLPQTGTSAADRESGHVSPLFVVGVWRSGTTLLYVLLNQHPDVRLFFEGNLPVLWPMFRFPLSRKTWVTKWEYWNAGVSRHGLDPHRLAVPITSLADAAEVAGREYCRQKGAKIWGCKSPFYYDRLVSLAREFPKARFIVIWRDPGEICRSVIEAAAYSQWFARHGMTHRAILASETLKQQCDRLLSMGVRLRQIHYRDLVDDTSNTMRGICEFLEIPFTPAVTVLDGADRSALFEGAHHALAKGNHIVSSRERNGALAPAIASKIRRYQALWKAEAGDDWLLCQHFFETGEARPGIWERFTDRLWFKILRLTDSAPRVIYSILPRGVWQSYRFLRYRDTQYVHSQLTTKQTTIRRNLDR